MPPPGRIEISTRRSPATARAAAAPRSTTSARHISIFDSEIVDNPGPMIPDPLDPEEMIPAPGVYEPDSSAIANEGEFDGVGTIRIADSRLARQLLRARRRRRSPTSATATSSSRTRTSPTTRPRPTGGAHLLRRRQADDHRTARSPATTAHDGGGIYSARRVDRDRPAPEDHDHRRPIVENDAIGPPQRPATPRRRRRHRQRRRGPPHPHRRHHRRQHGRRRRRRPRNGGRASMAMTRVTFADNETNDEGGGA